MLIYFGRLANTLFSAIEVSLTNVSSDMVIELHFPIPLRLKSYVNVLILIDLDWSVVSIFDFYAKEFLCNSQIFHIKSLTQMLFNCYNHTALLASDDEVIDIQCNVCPFAICALMYPDTWIECWLLKIEFRKYLGDDVKLSTRDCLSP